MLATRAKGLPPLQPPLSLLSMPLRRCLGRVVQPMSPPPLPRELPRARLCMFRNQFPMVSGPSFSLLPQQALYRCPPLGTSFIAATRGAYPPMLLRNIQASAERMKFGDGGRKNLELAFEE